MVTARERAEQRLLKTETNRRKADSRDAAYLEIRRAQEAANQEKTRRLRELRLAHEATLPKPEKPKKRSRKAG